MAMKRRRHKAVYKHIRHIWQWAILELQDLLLPTRASER